MPLDTPSWNLAFYSNSDPVFPVCRVTSLSPLTITETPPANSTGIYAAYDVVMGLLALPLRGAKGMGYVTGVKVIDERNQKNPIDFWFFKRVPTTLIADNANMALVAADLDAMGMSARVAVAAADYLNPGNGSLAIASLALTSDKIVHFDAQDYLFIYPALPSGTPTYTATTDLSFEFALYCA